MTIRAGISSDFPCRPVTLNPVTIGARLGGVNDWSLDQNALLDPRARPGGRHHQCGIEIAAREMRGR